MKGYSRKGIAKGQNEGRREGNFSIFDDGDNSKKDRLYLTRHAEQRLQQRNGSRRQVLDGRGGAVMVGDVVVTVIPEATKNASRAVHKTRMAKKDLGTVGTSRHQVEITRDKILQSKTSTFFVEIPVEHKHCGTLVGNRALQKFVKEATNNINIDFACPARYPGATAPGALFIVTTDDADQKLLNFTKTILAPKLRSLGISLTTEVQATKTLNFIRMLKLKEPKNHADTQKTKSKKQAKMEAKMKKEAKWEAKKQAYMEAVARERERKKMNKKINADAKQQEEMEGVDVKQQEGKKGATTDVIPNPETQKQDANMTIRKNQEKTEMEKAKADAKKQARRERMKAKKDMQIVWKK